MKLLTNGERVDLENPICIGEENDELLEKIVKFLETLTGEKVEVKLVKEKGRSIKSIERHPVRWTAEERMLLLDANLSDEELTEKISKESGRTGTSILMQKSEFVPQFISWAKSKGYSANDISKTIIEKFMEEKNENSKRR